MYIFLLFSWCMLYENWYIYINIYICLSDVHVHKSMNIGIYDYMHLKILYQCIQHCDAKRADRRSVSKHCDAKCADRRSVSNIASCSADCAETSIFETEANVRSSCRHRSELQRRQRSTIHLQTRVEGTRLLPTNIASSSANSAASSFNQRQRYECPADKRSELQRRQRSIHLSTRGKGTNVSCRQT